MLKKFKTFFDTLNGICLINELFVFHQKEFLGSIIFMSFLSIKSVNFIYKNVLNFSTTYFNKVSSRLEDERTTEKVYRKNEYLDDGTMKRPNYFVAVQITDQQIHSFVKFVQDHIVLQNENLANSMISTSTLHITLMVMHLKDSDDISKATKALSAVHQEFNRIICNNSLQLEFCGIGDFNDRVLFAKLKKNEAYEILRDLAKRVTVNMEMVGLYSTDKRKEFNPHLTIAKLDHRKTHLKQIKRIERIFYKDLTDLHFGFDTIKSIQLLKMCGPKTPSGYYSGEELFFNPNGKIAWKTLNALLAISEKKKEVRNRISMITKKFTE